MFALAILLTGCSNGGEEIQKFEVALNTSSPTPSTSPFTKPSSKPSSKVTAKAKSTKNPVKLSPTAKSSVTPTPSPVKLSPTAKSSVTPTPSPSAKESANPGKYVPGNDPRPVGVDYVAPSFTVETLGCTTDNDYIIIKSLVHLKGGVYNYKVGWAPAVPIYNGEELTVKINLALPKDNIMPEFSYSNVALYLTGIHSGKSYRIDTGKIKPSDFCKV